MSLSAVDRISNQWRPPSDLYSTGASGAVAVRPVQPAQPVESIDALGAGTIVHLSNASGVPEEVRHDWTLAETARQAPQAIEEPARDPPLYKQLIDIVQSMWRASGNAVQIAEEINQTTLPDRLGQLSRAEANNEPLTYDTPSVKRTGG